MKYKIEATIPTTQYGNIRPTFEIESEEEEQIALARLHSLWGKYGEKPLNVSTGQIEASQGTLERRQTFTGEVIMWDKDNHIYTDENGNVLKSASQYADEHSPKFDIDMLAPKTANSWGVDEESLRDIWKLNGNVSNAWGTSIHAALELYHKYHTVGSTIQTKKELEDNYVLPKNPYLRKIVKEFVELAGTDALVEVLVSDVKNRMAGTIDRLSITGEKSCRIGDYKTNNEMDAKKLLKYQKQLSYYAHILMNNGWTVEGLDIFYLNAEDGWSIEKLKVLPLEA